MYVSFSSFLAIQRSNDSRSENVTAASQQASAAEARGSEEAASPMQAARDNAGAEGKGRTRPVRSKVDPWGCSGNASKAVEKLIGLGSSSAGKKKKAAGKGPLVADHREAPSRYSKKDEPEARPKASPANTHKEGSWGTVSRQSASLSACSSSAPRSESHKHG